ncbi:Arm DNA-binding domain-containing protein [Actibacterium sp. 188UL27-1]|uniref:Arm DNA-binding domain-containing protein n=1 Tax=Actibacterium sp. 188UL27-1 TaxID=2786961 RepID=UPI001956B157|nr:Arm DNA-binding domain-containing protein [Actibacterium sp. 188UL27-1]MBM7068482.1 DUF4102 domain-containing protein [Actibacterium sp. 188UL27-1]
MLTDVALKNLNSKGKPDKVTHRDGMYVHVAKSGPITFQFDYRLNGLKESVVTDLPIFRSLERARSASMPDECSDKVCHPRRSI